MSLYHRKYQMSFRKLFSLLGILLFCSYPVTAEDFTGRVGNTTHTWIDLDSTSIDDSQVYSWNGNGSIINKNYLEGGRGYGIEEDVALIHSGSSKPVIFFQWQVCTACTDEEGNEKPLSNLSIQWSDPYIPISPLKANIIYGEWNTLSSQKIIYRNVELDYGKPFIIDPTRDGFKVKNGSWFVIAIAFDDFDNNTRTIKAIPTSKPSHYGFPYGEIFSSYLNVDGFMWMGVGSLMTHGIGQSDSITQDVVLIEPNQPTVSLFQWNRSTGRKLSAKTNGCNYPVKVTYKEWDAKEDEVRSFNITLNHNPQRLLGEVFGGGDPYEEIPPNSSWILVKIEGETFQEKCKLYLGTDKSRKEWHQ